MTEEEHNAWMAQARGEAPVTRSAGPERSRFDRIEQRKEDGYSQDFWLSDSKTGREEIARLEARAAAPRRQSSDFSRKQLEELAESIAAQFVVERKALRADVKSELLDAKEQLIGMLASAMKVEHEIGKLKAELDEVRKAMPLRAVSSKSA